MKLLTALTFLLLAGCTQIQTGPLPPPPERLMCEGLPDKPALKPLEAITLPDGVKVYRKADVDARDVSIAGYIVNLRGAWFTCSSNLAWVKAFVDGQD